VAPRTPPFEGEGFCIMVGFMIEKIKEDYFCFYKIKDTDMRMN
jgi:hypothetical protein